MLDPSVLESPQTFYQYCSGVEKELLLASWNDFALLSTPSDTSLIDLADSWSGFGNQSPICMCDIGLQLIISSCLRGSQKFLSRLPPPFFSYSTQSECRCLLCWIALFWLRLVFKASLSDVTFPRLDRRSAFSFSKFLIVSLRRSTSEMVATSGSIVLIHMEGSHAYDNLIVLALDFTQVEYGTVAMHVYCPNSFFPIRYILPQALRNFFIKPGFSIPSAKSSSSNYRSSGLFPQWIP